MGRPKKKRLPPTRGITPLRAVRIDQETWDRAIRVADQLNMATSEFVRRSIVAELHHYEPLLDGRRPDLPSSLGG